MSLHKKYRKMLALILALAITVSGVMVNFPATNGEFVQFGEEVEAITDGGIWSQKASRSTATYYSTAAEINGEMYVFGGYNSDEVWKYNPQDNVWTKKRNAPMSFYKASTIKLNTKLYVFYYEHLYEYNPATDIWTSKCSGGPDGWGGGSTAVEINGKIYVFGGFNEGYPAWGVWVYDPVTDSWSKKEYNSSNRPNARVNHSAVAINGKMYVFGGHNGSGVGGLFDLWEYDPVTNGWTQKANGPYLGHSSSSVVINGKMYVFGGTTCDSGGYYSCYNSLWEYDPVNNTWTQDPSGATARYGSSAAAINGKMYIFGGINASYTQFNDLWEYSPNLAPNITTITPSENQPFSEANTSFIPQILVSDENDADNNTLTCKYYIDSETTPRNTKTVSNAITPQTVSFTPLNMNLLSEGTHTITYKVNDSIIPAPVTKTVSFKVDKTAPTIGSVNRTSSINSITISGAATDSFAGLAATPYRYTIGSEVSAWGTATTYTSLSNLLPNTKYAALFEARDAAGNIASESKKLYTKANIPILEVSNATSYTLQVSAPDNNPDYTQYQISVSNNNETKYVTQEGTVTATPVWITLTNKAIKVKGLNPNTIYTFSAKARNEFAVETVMSSETSGTTLIAPAAPPANIIATATDSTITLAWEAVSGAISYDIVVDKAVDEITEQDIINVASNEYIHSGFYPGTPHTFLVRSRNEGDPGIWSSKITKSTLPSDPSVPANLNAVPLTTSITVVWSNVPGATGYDIQYDWDLQNDKDQKNIVAIGPNTNYVHSSLTPGKSHIYRVRSINTGGKSEWSAPIETSTLVEAVPVPVNVKAEPTKNSIILSWDAVEGATGYTVEVDGEKYDISRNTYTHSNLTSDTQPHIYSVRAHKNGRSSDWSSAIIAYTLADKFGTPVNFEASSDDFSVSLSWDTVKDAISYELQRNNVTIDNISETSCIDNGLSQNETYTYRVRAISETGFSDWTSPIEVKLKELSTPKNLEATSDETSISISWGTVVGATSYDVEFDGSTETVTTTTYSAINLISGSQHKIRVMARNENGGTSSWSTPLLKSTLFAMGDVPNVSAITKKNSITVMWNSINGAVGYEVEVNGIVISNVTGSAITFRDLPAETQYEYRVRAINSTGSGSWSNMLNVFTLPQGPSTPTNVKASATMTSILVTWDKVAGATEYDICITDGKTNEESIIQVGSDNSYLHTGLSPDRIFKYKVMAKNISGESYWSVKIKISTLSSEQIFNISSTTGEEFNLVLSASNIQDISSYSFRVQYNTEDFEVMDLCGLTTKLDTQAGDIAGTDISVSYVAPGTIVFVKTGSVNSWQVWSGIVNTIKLKAKHDGEAAITYSMQ